MKILLYQSASEVDAIAMLGLAQVLGEQHHVDILVPKKQAYLFEGSIEGTILYFEAYPLPQQSSQRGLAVKIDQHFGRAYDTCIHTYVPSHVPRYFEDEYDKDRITHLYGVMSTIGITLPERHRLQHNFIYTEADEALVNAFAKSINIAKPIMLCDENEGFNKPTWFTPSFLLELKSFGYVLAGRGAQYDINLAALDLKQISLFFASRCAAATLLYNSITHAILTQSCEFTNKKIILCAPHNTCNLTKAVSQEPEKYAFVVLSKPTKANMESIFGTGTVIETPVKYELRAFPTKKPKHRIEKPTPVALVAQVDSVKITGDLFLWIH